MSIEFRTSKTRKKGKSIQDALREVLFENLELDYIIYDHSSGEMADFITIQSKEVEFEVTLYHVKAMGAKTFTIFRGYYDDKYMKDDRWLLHDFLRVHRIYYGYNSHNYDVIMLDLLQYFSKLFGKDMRNKEGKDISKLR